MRSNANDTALPYPWRVSSLIRTKVLAVVIRPLDGAWLVQEGVDNVTGPFARPLGGSVEFGESAIDAVRREFLEELGCPLAHVEFVGVIENLFQLNGRDGHEIDFIFRAVLENECLYTQAVIPLLDVPGEAATWQHPRGTVRLVPEGLLDLFIDT